MVLTINESYEIMMELRKEVDMIREEAAKQEIKYNNLVTKYNEAVLLVKKGQKEWLR